MTDELKPVRCGCGGEAKVRPYRPLTMGLHDKHFDYYVQCEQCGINTLMKCTEAEAIEAWNRAMGADQFRDLTKKIERTAKVKKQFVLVTGGLGGVMPSCECGWTVNEEWKYCPQCGARLEWNE